MRLGMAGRCGTVCRYAGDGRAVGGWLFLAAIVLGLLLYLVYDQRFEVLASQTIV